MIESTTVEVLSRAQQFKALADPTRLTILELLSTGEHCVCELQAALEIPANLLSHHLKVLREADFIGSTRRGRWIDYRLHEHTLSEVRETLLLSREPKPPTAARSTEVRV